MGDQGELLHFDTRPPDGRDTLGFPLNVHGRRVRVGADLLAFTLAAAQASLSVRLPDRRAGARPSQHPLSPLPNPCPW